MFVKIGTSQLVRPVSIASADEWEAVYGTQRRPLICWALLGDDDREGQLHGLVDYQGEAWSAESVPGFTAFAPRRSPGMFP